MNKEELNALVSLLMVSDPWPLSNIQYDIIVNFADKQSKLFGYDNWIDAYHRIKVI